MKSASLLIAAALLIACAAQDEQEAKSTQDEVQAVRDFIEVRGLEKLDKIAGPAPLVDEEAIADGVPAVAVC